MCTNAVILTIAVFLNTYMELYNCIVMLQSYTHYIMLLVYVLHVHMYTV